MAEPRITIVTVAYNSADVLPSMLESVPSGAPVIIVDNASRDREALRALAARYANVTLIENAENEGFGRACNIGAAAAHTEFVMFLNPDTTCLDDTLDALTTAADAHPDAPAFNPLIVDDAWRAHLKRRSDLDPRAGTLAKGDPGGDVALPVLSGAALMVRRDIFERIGGFDPAIFLFFEDDDLSVRLAKHGPLMLAHSAIVRHFGGTSSSPSRVGERIKNWHWGWSQVYAVRKHRGPGACARPIAKALLRAASPATLLSGVRRRKYGARLTGMWAALRMRDAKM
ncbi:Glycosyltransferase, GT2 family [Roseovarius nanhaiticus]|uniref:Glycosyltransferase, GT2 family n=1 Tax=Roseovarius nanhaiticus TaxID=573024 RepID=A0A1N7FEK6_9RHOB|nr:glycosyltransferase family 2 protein [Roseovarius nanhaiticus]SEK56500.1 Glycosyltransferase, GT2 family [Roseovarius nanhaiticus]SIR98656.1 Glycosyltransferase, GT2 family [Roseovarius nanhaiticus]